MAYLDRILTTLRGLQEKIRANVGSSPLALEHVHFPRLNKINDYVYEVCKPTGRPSVEIVFFHGLQLEHTSSKEAYFYTWTSNDKSELWLKWLLQDFPDARILIISYQGLDMYLTSENLVHSFTRCEAPIGQDGCPVVLVGHCLGGLVMKELCVQASSMLSLKSQDEFDTTVDNLLLNVKGVFTYASPHHGSRLVDNNIEFREGPLFEDCTMLNKDTARRNEKFRMLRKKYGWKAFGIGESQEVTLEKLNFTGIVVPEASARHDVDGFHTIVANHFNVCRPIDRHSDSFQLLTNFIARVLKEDKIPKGGLLAGLEIIGLDSSIERLQKKLPEAQRLGIVGMGGIGKTTLAKALFDKISRDFEYTCFLQKVKDVIGDEEDPRKLRKTIMDDLKKGGRDVTKPFEWHTLKGKKVLIILDDVECEYHVNMIDSNDYFSRESRVIVTTRNGRFLHPLNFELLEHEALDLNNSKILFCLQAFDRRVAYPKYEDQVTKFAEKCGGLPLALKVSGRYLRNQTSLATWDGALETLREAKPLNGSADKDGLWSILRISFNSLAWSEQEMFLDVATYLYHQKLEYAQKIWSMCSWGTPNGWLNLLDRNLVSEDQWGHISMHEVLRDLGRARAGDNRQMRMRINLETQIQLSKKEKKKVKELQLWGRGYFNAGAVSGLKNLEILHVSQVLPDGQVSHLLHKLAVLVFSGSASPLVEFREEHEEKELIALQQLFEVQSLRYVSLRSLDIRYVPHGLCRLSSQLIHLEIIYCFFLEVLSGFEIGQFQRLKYLSITSCHELKEFSDSFVCLDALENLKIQDCPSLVSLPVEFGQLRRLQCLSIDGCKSLEELPDSFGQLQGLRHLSINGCTSLEELPDSFGQLQGLRHLSITACESLKELLISFALLDALEELTIRHCSKLEISLPCLRNLRSPQRLHISDCKRIATASGWYELSITHRWPWYDSDDELLWVLSKFSINRLSLQELDLMRAFEDDEDFVALIPVLGHSAGISYCGSLANLPKSMVKSLEIQGWTEEVMDLANFDELQDLIIKYIDFFELHRFPRQLSRLQRLKVASCGSLEALSDISGHLQALQALEIADYEFSRTLPDTLGDLQALQRLKTLPDSLGDLQALQRLNISYCHSLEALPDTLGHLQALHHLEISYCDSLEALPDTLGHLRALQSLGISFCDSLKALPDTLGHLQALQSLKVGDCNSLEALPDSLGHLQALQHLKIVGCNSLEALPDSLGHLQALQHLEIYRCNFLKSLPPLGNLRALKYMNHHTLNFLRTP